MSVILSSRPDHSPCFGHNGNWTNIAQSDHVIVTPSALISSRLVFYFLRSFFSTKTISRSNESKKNLMIIVVFAAENENWIKNITFSSIKKHQISTRAHSELPWSETFFQIWLRSCTMRVHTFDCTYII